MKTFLKKYFKNLAFFYHFVGWRMFVMAGISLAVSVLDGFGLAMFLPLLQMVSGADGVDAGQMGNLGFIMEAAENVGISLTLVTVLIFMILFFLFKGIATYFNHYYSVVLQQTFVKTIRLRLLDSLNAINFKYFIDTDAGRIQNTMSGEVDRVVRAFLTYFRSFQQAVMVAVYLGFAFVLDAQFAVLVTIGGALTNLLFRLIYKRTKSSSERFTSTSHNYQGLIIQHVGNFKYLRATGTTQKYTKKLRDSVEEIEKSRKKIGLLSGIAAAAREPLLIIVVASVILIQTQILEGSMAAILLSLLFFYRALSSLVLMQEQWNDFLSVSGSVENMRELQAELHEQREKVGKKTFTSFKKAIQLSDLSFSYGSRDVLREINLSIAKNESVAFVGESGSGKTTLVNLIAGLLEAEKGALTIDGTSIQEYNKLTYQQRIGYITQEPVIFSDTIYNNVSFWAEPTPENIARFEKAIHQASLSQFVESLPLRENALLGNNGINLSGGQRQRISIARELFKDIDLLIMDEATSALDSETEKAIQESIEALQGEYTLIIVAHRLSTIRNVDKVVYMYEGEILESGDFNSLMKKSPAFKKMVELQEL